MSDEPTTRLGIYERGSRGQRVSLRAARVAAVLAFVTSVLAGFALSDPMHPLSRFFPLLAMLWAVIPPIWFWYEYYYLYLEDHQPASFERFKHGQQLAVAIWAGMAVSLGALAASDRFKPPASQPDSSCGCTRPAGKTQ